MTLALMNKECFAPIVDPGDNSYFIHREKSRGFFSWSSFANFDPEEAFLHELASAKMLPRGQNWQTRP